MQPNVVVKGLLVCGFTAFCLIDGGLLHAQQQVRPAAMKAIATVDPRFQSYNIEMVEVTGGRFWKPYSQVAAEKSAESPDKAANHPIGIDPSLFEYRPPIDLSSPRLRKLAAALGPAYVRVSGTWQNTTYFQDSDAPAPTAPPKGFNGTLTRAEWKGVVDFAKATHAGIVTSFATSAGTRDARGVWTPDQAAKFLAYTKSVGGSIAAAEFMNEPTMPEVGGAPTGYDGAAFGKDIAVFIPFMRSASPGTILLGTGSVGEGSSLLPPTMKFLKAEDMLKATGPVFDAISYHFYGGVSSRCSGTMGKSLGTGEETALSDDWLDRTVATEAFYAGLRDRFEPGKKIWLTETGQTACGGDLWASTFVDSFRYLNQLGALAQRGVQVVAHNTLAASDYALLDPKTFAPRPNYWAALLWHRFIGTTVLDPGVAKTPHVHVYAHCMRDVPGGVSLLVINSDRKSPFALELPEKSERYTLTSDDLVSPRARLNGVALSLGEGDQLPKLEAVHVAAGQQSFAPVSITFLTMPGASNPACR